MYLPAPIIRVGNIGEMVFPLGLQNEIVDEKPLGDLRIEDIVIEKCIAELAAHPVEPKNYAFVGKED